MDRNKKGTTKTKLDEVALLAEGVDRNWKAYPKKTGKQYVALLAEGVDRNISRASNPPSAVVALLAEGVDRNTLVLVKGDGSAGRPPRGGRG